MAPRLMVDGLPLLQPDFAGRGLANVAPTVLRLLARRANPTPEHDTSAGDNANAVCGQAPAAAATGHGVGGQAEGGQATGGDRATEHGAGGQAASREAATGPVHESRVHGASTTDSLVSLPDLDEHVLPPHLREGISTVVLLVVDGLGHLQLQREVAAGAAPNLGALLARAASGDDAVSYAPITSVFPTTTVAALGAVNSGVQTTAHGLLGYTLYLPEFDMVAEMIRWGPLNRRVSFSDPEFGCAPEQFFWSPTMYARLHQAGVGRTFAVNPNHFSGTALTRMLHQDAEYQGYIATSSLEPIVRRLVEDSTEPTYIYAYWPTVDTIAHLVGPLTAEHSAEVTAVDAMLGRLVRGAPGRGRTLLLMTADHGHIATHPDRIRSLGEHPELLQMLRVPPAGERRVVYLHPRQGARDEVAAYARERLRDIGALLPRDEAVSAGLFGPGELPPRAAERIGELLLFARDNVQIVTPIDPPPPESSRPVGPPPRFFGLHGGLSDDEALVPLLAARL